MVAAVSAIDLRDSHGGLALLRASGELWSFFAPCLADPSYDGDCVGSATAITMEIVQPEEGQKRFGVQPRCWIIVRTFGGIAQCPRFACVTRPPLPAHPPCSRLPPS
ncbi:hypothetical protein ASF59_03145 [Methylobacterium sp. Leaf121]|nr:hypothetical protein ASF59_03145 [Methylobacterium sp. Leaf121]